MYIYIRTNISLYQYYIIYAYKYRFVCIYVYMVYGTRNYVQLSASRATGRGADREAIAITMVALVPTAWTGQQVQQWPSWHVISVTLLKLIYIYIQTLQNPHRIGFKHYVLLWVWWKASTSHLNPFDQLTETEPIQLQSNGCCRKQYLYLHIRMHVYIYIYIHNSNICVYIIYIYIYVYMDSRLWK